MCHVAHSMKISNNNDRINLYLKKYNIKEYLQDYELLLYSFDAYEKLNEKLNPKQFLLFLVSGEVALKAVRSDGSLSQTAIAKPFTCFGEMEFAYPEAKQNIIETVTKCEMIGIDIEKYKSKIENDANLLNLLLKSVVRKIAIISDILYETTDVQSRVLFYLEKEAKAHEIHGVEQLSQHLNCSRRQLQRVLKNMVNEGMIVKKKKGVYVKK